ncbi:MAG: polysaccharide biosynthesis protein [Actinobacteria bacterium]|nr:polysaccharide biosynthesis protein [Actinomycetota bacterium]
MFAAATIAAIVQLLTGATTGLYRGRFRYGSFDEVANLVRAVMVTTIALAVVNRLNSQYFIPTSVVFIGGFIALMLMAGSRYVWRLLLDRRLRPNKDKGTPVLVFGAGEGGVQVVTSMQRNPESPYVPVALLDDNPAKSSLRVLGISVEGDRSSIAEAAKAHSAEMMVIAIPSAPPELLRELTDLALQAKLKVAVLPPLSEMFGAVIGISDIRPVTEADLLGRHVINTDIESIAGYITGKRVLVTGAGGSIGSELCHQLAKFAPDKLVMLDRDESALHGVQMLIEGRALLDDPNLVVCDIRDADRVLEVFKLHQPQVVFHTAALKHLPLLQLHPGEAVKTNVHGTENLLTVATACGVERFVNISTDKAADPTSVLGYSKRIAERLTAASSADTDGNYLSVRFGNVLGSRGSVLTAFRAQVDAGGPITVTDPEVTRFFMTVEEAVELVIQAGAVGRAGEALVFDMGEPVKIDDVARRFAATAERPVEIVYTGLRSGEKLHEVLLGEGEIDQRPAHPLIAHVTVPPLKIGAVAATVGDAGGDELIALLKALAYGSHETPDAGAAQEQPAAAPETDA